MCAWSVLDVTFLCVYLRKFQKFAYKCCLEIIARECIKCAGCYVVGVPTV